MANERQAKTFPQHYKLAAVSEKSQVCGEFLSWLESKGFVLAEYGKSKRYEDTLYQASESKTDLLADFFGIDQVKLEAEKEAMLAEIRARSEA